MTFYEYLESTVKPDGFGKENYSKLYRAMGKVFDQLLSDAKTTVSNFFPLLSDEEALEKHRISLFIPTYPEDSKDMIQNRVGTSYTYLERMGERGLLEEYLHANFRDRWSYVEIPNDSWRMGMSRLGKETYLHSIAGVRVYVTGITPEEKKKLGLFLDDFLEADVEFKIFEQNQKLLILGWKMGVSQLGVNTFLGHNGGKDESY